MHLHPLYFPTYHRCYDCQGFKVASALQILPERCWNRQRYFCPDCATAKGCHPAEELLNRVAEQQGHHTICASQPRQQQAIARSRGK